MSPEARKKDPSLPESYVARAICYEHSDSKREQWLLSSLVDATKYPRDEVVAMYHERREIELGYDEINRSKTVKGSQAGVVGDNVGVHRDARDDSEKTLTPTRGDREVHLAAATHRQTQPARSKDQDEQVPQEASQATSLPIENCRQQQKVYVVDAKLIRVLRDGDRRLIERKLAAPELKDVRSVTVRSGEREATFVPHNADDSKFAYWSLESGWRPPCSWKMPSGLGTDHAPRWIVKTSSRACVRTFPRGGLS